VPAPARLFCRKSGDYAMNACVNAPAIRPWRLGNRKREVGHSSPRAYGARGKRHAPAHFLPGQGNDCISGPVARQWWRCWLYARCPMAGIRSPRDSTLWKNLGTVCAMNHVVLIRNIGKKRPARQTAIPATNYSVPATGWVIMAAELCEGGYNWGYEQLPGCIL